MKGFRDYYNFLRPHIGIEGQTPAEAVDMDLELGRNRLENLIKLSSAKIPSALSSFNFLITSLRCNIYVSS
jgi:hypothetical protein